MGKGRMPLPVTRKLGSWNGGVVPNNARTVLKIASTRTANESDNTMRAGLSVTVQKQIQNRSHRPTRE
jgi:hypothetical protein